MKSPISLNPQLLLRLLIRLRTLLVILAVLAVAGYTLYQISLITSISPDDTTMAAERAKVDALRIKFDTKTIQAISKQTPVTAAPGLQNIGKTDPFYQ